MTWGIHWCNFQWPWPIQNPDFKVIGVFVVNSTEIALYIPPQIAYFMNRETEDKIIVNAKNTESG